MHTDFLPTRKIPVSQLYAWNSQRAFPLEIDLSHRGCLIRDQASGTEWKKRRKKAKADKFCRNLQRKRLGKLQGGSQ